MDILGLSDSSIIVAQKHTTRRDFRHYNHNSCDTKTVSMLLSYLELAGVAIFGIFFFHTEYHP